MCIQNVPRTSEQGFFLVSFSYCDKTYIQYLLPEPLYSSVPSLGLSQLSPFPPYSASSSACPTRQQMVPYPLPYTERSPFNTKSNIRLDSRWALGVNRGLMTSILVSHSIRHTQLCNVPCLPNYNGTMSGHSCLFASLLCSLKSIIIFVCLNWLFCFYFRILARPAAQKNINIFSCTVPQLLCIIIIRADRATLCLVQDCSSGLKPYSDIYPVQSAHMTNQSSSRNISNAHRAEKKYTNQPTGINLGFLLANRS